MIRGAPWAFAISVVSLNILLVAGETWFFHENLQRKDDLISSGKRVEDRLAQELTEANKALAELRKKPTVSENDYREFQSNNVQTIRHHRYTNETVDVDGKLFDQCIFENATLAYHGQGPVTFIKSQFKGTIALQTDHAAAKVYLALTSFLRSLPGVNRLTIGEKDIDTGNLRIFSDERMVSGPEQPPQRKQPKSK